MARYELKEYYDTYHGWRTRGRQVRKGERARGLWEKNYYFHINQTDPRRQFEDEYFEEDLQLADIFDVDPWGDS